MGTCRKPKSEYKYKYKNGQTGRPAKYANPEIMGKAIDAYFEATNTPTVNGLALALDFCDFNQLYDYRRRPEFKDLIKRALTRVRERYERGATGMYPAGSIFLLKVMGMREDNPKFLDEEEQAQDRDEMLAKITQALGAMGYEIKKKTM